MANYTIKKTTSLSPISCQEIGAEVILEGNRVYLLKRDEQGTLYKTLVEKDPEFYRFLTRNKANTQCLPSIIVMYISSRCNLNCPVCYEYAADLKEPSLKEIERLLSGFKKRAISLLGREPTCREDLCEIIKIANRHNTAILSTNGVKLADYGYALKLKKSGLKNIFFSFNGFDELIYERMNGMALLDYKLRALENIRRLGIRTIISATIARGVNDNQVSKLCRYCFENSSFITELRLRSITPIGKHLGIEPYCMSEMADLAGKALGVSREDLIKEHLFWEELIKTARLFIPDHLHNFFKPRLCSVRFHIKDNNGFSPLGRDIDIEKIKRSRLKLPLLAYYLLRNFGVGYIIDKLCRFINLPTLIKNKKILGVCLRCWPNIGNLDLEENKKCGSIYYRGDKGAPFCYSNIIALEKAIKEKNTSDAVH
ncbi:MAG: radical SAM protein [Clostridia bacterium]